MDLTLRFGAAAAGAARSSSHVEFALPNPVLFGAETELCEDRPGAACAGSPLLWRQGDALWGMAVAEPDDVGFERAAARAYGEVLDAARGLHLHRIWNFVPHINGVGADGLENYRAFCIGRGAALDQAFGAAAEGVLPAATGVGTSGNRLAVVFVAGAQAPRHLENPAQIPAYRYPARYGPRSPSFARGTLVEHAGSARLYVSGTGAIRGSESLHGGDVVAQCRVVLENIALVAGSGGLDGLDRETGGRRRFRVYLREPDHWPRVQPLLNARLLRDGDALQVLQADICRGELLMEIEARVDGATPAQSSSQ